jgi:[ribosomal protein S18]-alanine N-acetyltransferase
MNSVQKLSAINASEIAQIASLCFENPWSLNQFQAHFRTHSGLGVFDITGCLIAFCLYSQVFTEIEILDIAVLPEFRKKGLAQTLIQKLKEIANTEKCEKIMLEVALYKKEKFTEIGLRKSYYSNGHNALLMDFYV